MEGIFEATIPGKRAGDVYSIEVKYAGQGQFNSQKMSIENSLPHITDLDMEMLARVEVAVANVGIKNISADKQFKNLHEFLMIAFVEGMKEKYGVET